MADVLDLSVSSLLSISTSATSLSIASDLNLSVSSDEEANLSINSDCLSGDSLAEPETESDDELTQSKLSASTSVDPAEEGLPLFPGSTLTVFGSYFLPLEYSLRHGLTKSAFSDLIGLVSKHLPIGSATTSLYKLRRYFVDLFSDIAYQTHYCCSCCHRHLEEATQPCPSGCGGDVIDFLTISVEAQLKRRMEG